MNKSQNDRYRLPVSTIAASSEIPILIVSSFTLVSNVHVNYFPGKLAVNVGEMVWESNNMVSKV